MLWGPSWEGEGTPGYWPWVQVLRGYLHDAPPERLAALAESGLGEVARLVPELAAFAPPAGADRAVSKRGRFELFDAVARPLTDAAHSQPLVLILDDLQWADPPSVELLGFLSRRLHSAALLVLGTYRDIEVTHDHPLAPLLADLASRSVVVPLAGLGAPDVARLMAAVADEEPGDEMAALIQRRTGGNPFFVQEVVRVLVARHAGLQISRAVPALPEGVRETIERRLARLSQPCNRVLEVAAVAGSATTVTMLSRITSDAVPTLIGLLTEAVRARILEEPPSALGTYRFAHDLFRETIYEGLDPSARASLHLRVADALETARAAGSDVRLSELAHHYVQAAGSGGEEKALLYSMRAADEAAARLSYEEAAALYQHALEMLDLGARSAEISRMDLLLERAEALRLTGRAQDAREALEAAVALARRDRDAAGLARGALGIHALGAETGFHHAEQMELLNEALSAIGDEHAELRARLLAGLAQELIWSEADTDTSRARRAAEQACDIARTSGRPDTLALCLLARHDVVWGPGTEGERLELTDEIIALAERAQDRQLLMEARLLRCTALLGLGDARAMIELERFVHEGLESPQARIRYLALSRSATVAVMSGRFDEAERLIADARALADEIDEPDGWQVMYAQLSELRSAQGRRFELLDDERLTRAVAAHTIGRMFFEVARMEQGETGSGADALLELGLDDIPRLSSLATLAAVARLAVAARRTDACHRLFDALLPFAGTNVVNAGAVTFMGAVSYYLGLLARALGRSDEAKAHLEAALEMHERLGALPWAARARYELGCVLVADPASAERGRELLAEAQAAAGRLGMTALARVIADGRGATEVSLDTNVFRREGAMWTLAYAGTTVRIRDAKGLRDLAALLGAPGKPIHAAELVAATSTEVAEASSRLGADDVIDERARREYRARLAELEDDIAEAEADNDPERAARAKQERDVLAHELAAALGLSGRARRLGDTSERARKTVTARIRDSISRIERIHPLLGEHLQASVTTGTFCSYSPTQPIEWRL